MTYEEAKECINEYIYRLEAREEFFADIDVLEMCHDALEKQIPKSPTYEADGYADCELVYDTWYCPNCGKDYEVGYDDYGYCPCCGQRIDRSEVEE